MNLYIIWVKNSYLIHVLFKNFNFLCDSFLQYSTQFR